MHVGDQSVGLTAPELQFLARHNVRHVDAALGGHDHVLLMAADDFREAIATAAEHGISVEIRAANSWDPGGPTGPLGTPSRTPWILSRQGTWHRKRSYTSACRTFGSTVRSTAAH